MKGKGGATSTDLLVCFPSRGHLTLRPKAICSPGRPLEPNKRHFHHKKSSSLSQPSPLLWARTKHMDSDISEPTSPKVTCAGQIKVRHKTGSCKNWQSVMEEIERIHNHKKNHKKRPSWVQALGFKKDVMQFLTCLRNIKFDFRCFGSFPVQDITTDDEEEDEVHEEEIEEEDSKTVFSKWFMLLQENHENKEKTEVVKTEKSCHEDDDVAVPSVPPPNALLLMRCRSAPAKSLTEERKDEENEREDPMKKSKLRELFMEDQDHENMIKKKRALENNLVVMRYDTDFYKLSSDIAKETWVVGGIRDPFSRSLSWKR